MTSATSTTAFKNVSAVEQRESTAVATPSSSSSEEAIRVVAISLLGVTVELTSLGASITRWLVPSSLSSSSSTNVHDDIVLGYQSPHAMWATGNPCYFGVIVGRVANRIEMGRLKLGPEYGGYENQLDINNPPNHLHGGIRGFSHTIWPQLEIVQLADDVPGVRFSMVSPDGDQGYPGTVQISATYSLVPGRSCIEQAPTDNDGAVTPPKQSVILRLEMRAVLLSNENKPTPVNLAQHSYFNLAGHSAKEGILQHVLQLHCEGYTPVDAHAIPTRHVQWFTDHNSNSVIDPEIAAMDFTQPRSLRNAVIAYGMAYHGMSQEEAAAKTDQQHRCNESDEAPFVPFGIDHNYVLRRGCHHDDDVSSTGAHFDADAVHTSLMPAATLVHPATGRTLYVRTDQPGIQVYSGNFLNGQNPPSTHNKDKVAYHRWQSLCLETQSFPNAIHVDPAQYPDFAQGKCCILTPESPTYQHRVEYELLF